MARTTSQAQTWVNFDFEVKFDLKCHDQSTPKTIEILTKVVYTYGPSLMILASTGNESSLGQTWWRTDGRTDGRTDRRWQRQYPKTLGKNGVVNTLLSQDGNANWNIYDNDMLVTLHNAIRID